MKIVNLQCENEVHIKGGGEEVGAKMVKEFWKYYLVLGIP